MVFFTISLKLIPHFFFGKQMDGRDCDALN